MDKLVIVKGVTEVIKLTIDQESVNIYIDKGDDQEPIHVVYWHLDEVEEDATVALAMCNAIDLFHTDPGELLDRINWHNYDKWAKS